MELGEYAVGQSGRFAWYLGHRLAGRRAARDIAPPANSGDAVHRPVPSFGKMLADIASLFAREAANVARGLYPAPDDGDGPPARLIAQARAYLADITLAGERRADGITRAAASLPQAKGLPDYYLQDFHFQDGGYLTDASAALYDTEVEALLIGAANAMRRQALVPLVEHFRTHDQRQARLLDIGCGTGRFLHQALQALPGLSVVGVDLSKAYLDEARRHLSSRRRVTLLEAPGEKLPLAGESVDAAVAIFLFHELPGTVRREVARETARVLKPGAPFVLIDSLQTGDRPDFDGLLDGFERSFHEPYYRSYLEDDLEACFSQAGLELTARWTAFLSKVMVLAKA